jgi:hypothetical protein
MCKLQKGVLTCFSLSIRDIQQAVGGVQVTPYAMLGKGSPGDIVGLVLEDMLGKFGR